MRMSALMIVGVLRHRTAAFGTTPHSLAKMLDEQGRGVEAELSCQFAGLIGTNGTLQFDAGSRQWGPWIVAALLLCVVISVALLVADPRNTQSNSTELFVLPDGVRIETGRDTTEARLIRALDNTTGEHGWIAFDRLRFEDGTTRLLMSSDDQFAKVASILKAYPVAHVRIAAYANGEGARRGAQDLSSVRARLVAIELESLGVAAERFETEGSAGPPGSTASVAMLVVPTQPRGLR